MIRYAIPELIIIDISLKNKPVIFGSNFRLIIMVIIKVNELNIIHIIVV